MYFGDAIVTLGPNLKRTRSTLTDIVGNLELTCNRDKREGQFYQLQVR
jgi:hypothetical protein